ncbi:NTP transferase domain-containing protein [Clostridiaceae bacterium 35-E11]
MQSDNIAAIILSGGYSSRMGDFKPLLPLGENRVIQKVIKSFLHGGIEDIRVVLGHRAKELIPYIKEMGVEYVFNKDYDKGMFSSVQEGIKSLKNEKIQAFFFIPVDYPMIKSTTILKLKKAYKENRAKIIYPCFCGERGHPPIISADYIDEILAYDGTGGLRSLLNQYEKNVLDIEIGDESILIDMDTKEDYERILKDINKEKTLTTIGCMNILKEFNVSQKVINHGKKVAQVSCHLAFLLNNKGLNLHIDRIKSAGLLHDIAKGNPNHAKLGEEIIETLGYREVSKIVGQHRDIHFCMDENITEAEIVYLADKLVKEDKMVLLEERFKTSLEKFMDQPHILSLVKERFDKAKIIKDRVEKILDGYIEDLLIDQPLNRCIL